MRVLKNYLIFFFVWGLIAAPLFGEVVKPTYALVGCRIHPVNGTPIDKGTIIIRNGKIEATGPAEKISIPEDAEVIDAKELDAYPGLIDAYTQYFLESTSPSTAQRQSRMMAASPPEERSWDKTGFLVVENLKFKKTTLDSLHRAGITTILVSPPQQIFAGLSALLNLNGERLPAMVLQDKVALHLYFTTARGSYPSSLMGTVALFRQSFYDAQHYDLQKKTFLRYPDKVSRPKYDAFLERLLPYVIEKKPVIFNCANLEDIKRAIRLIEEFDLNGYIAGANEAWRVIDWVKKARRPLLVSVDFKPPITSRYANMGEELKKKAEKEIYPHNPAELQKEKISFALVSGKISKPGDFLKNVRLAVEAGLPAEEALKALTIIPARYFGVDSYLGSIEPGKIANLILTKGELFTADCQVRRVFVDGLSFEVKTAEAKSTGKAAAVNLSGNWKASLVSQMGTLESTWELTQEGNKVSGMIASEMGNWEISEGTLSGNKLTMVIMANIMGQDMELTFEGEASKDKIRGTISFAGGSAEMTATRIPDAR